MKTKTMSTCGIQRGSYSLTTYICFRSLFISLYSAFFLITDPQVAISSKEMVNQGIVRLCGITLFLSHCSAHRSIVSLMGIMLKRDLISNCLCKSVFECMAQIKIVYEINLYSIAVLFTVLHFVLF